MNATGGQIGRPSDDDVVGGERRHHRDRVLLCKERHEEKHDRPDVHPSRCLTAIANVGKKRREIEERRHRVDAAGDPRDALGVNRQQHEHQPGEHRRENAKPCGAQPDRHHQQPIGGMDEDVQDVVQGRRHRATERCELVRQGRKWPHFIRHIPPDLVHPGAREPSWESTRRASGRAAARRQNRRGRSSR